MVTLQPFPVATFAGQIEVIDKGYGVARDGNGARYRARRVVLAFAGIELATCNLDEALLSLVDEAKQEQFIRSEARATAEGVVQEALRMYAAQRPPLGA